MYNITLHDYISSIFHKNQRNSVQSNNITSTILSGFVKGCILSHWSSHVLNLGLSALRNKYVKNILFNNSILTEQITRCMRYLHVRNFVIAINLQPTFTPVRVEWRAFEYIQSNVCQRCRIFEFTSSSLFVYSILVLLVIFCGFIKNYMYTNTNGLDFSATLSIFKTCVQIGL